MHQSWRRYDGCSKYLGETLMAETHTKDGHARSEFGYDRAGYSGFLRSTWAGRNDDVRRVLCCNSIQSDCIVAIDFHGNHRIEFTKSLDQIVSEGVVLSIMTIMSVFRAIWDLSATSEWWVCNSSGMLLAGCDGSIRAPASTSYSA